jgi:hypothetical protein|tara:strand:+ start:8017 stop:8637 length:621 start_codon:yes stop_codon:yes gene_type:complete
MAITNGYCTLAELKTYLGLSGSGQDDNLENAVDSASREIDGICDRFFYQTSSDAKYFTPDNALFIDVPDISSPSGLAVLIDTSDDGTHDTTLTINTDFYTKPLDAGNEVDGIQYQPITQITILDTRSSERFDPTIVKQIKITAQWGFSAVPHAIKQATLLQATRLFKRKDSPFSTYGNPETGTGELFNKFDPDAMKLIKKYIKRTL